VYGYFCYTLKCVGINIQKYWNNSYYYLHLAYLLDYKIIYFISLWECNLSWSSCSKFILSFPLYVLSELPNHFPRKKVEILNKHCPLMWNFTPICNINNSHSSNLNNKEKWSEFPNYCRRGWTFSSRLILLQWT
jgi:hypothetical protein